METKVLVTIDTEPDNMWDPDSRRRPKFANIAELSKIQRLFDKFRARPTYLTTFSVAKSDEVRALKDIAKSANCEIGSHLHPDETPPFKHHAKGDGSYVHHYPLDAQEQKMASLDGLITETFGRKPVSYRGGRYSFDENTICFLSKYGYLVDSSVTPEISWEDDGGSNFKKHSRRDYFIHREDGSGLLEIPVSIKIRSKMLKFLGPIYKNMPNWTHTEGILRRVADFDIVWLEPSFNSYEKMEWLCDALLKEGLGHLNIMFHSSCIIPGGTPYTMCNKEVEKFFDKLERLLHYLMKVKGLEAATLKEFYNYRKKNQCVNRGDNHGRCNFISAQDTERK